MRLRYVIFLRYTPPQKILGAPAHAGVVTGGHMCRDALFRMGIQSVRVSRVVLEMSKFRHFCPLPDCLPIRRHVTTIRDRFPPDPLIPPSVSKHSTVYRIRRGNLHPKIHTPQLRDRRAYQPPSPDPHDRSRGGGFFCQRFFARLENDTSDVTSDVAELLAYACVHRFSA